MRVATITLLILLFTQQDALADPYDPTKELIDSVDAKKKRIISQRHEACMRFMESKYYCGCLKRRVGAYVTFSEFVEFASISDADLEALDSLQLETANLVRNHHKECREEESFRIELDSR